MLRTENIYKRFGSFTLNNINLDIAKGEYYVLLGRSGAGKSQLLELLCGLTSPDSGRIFLNGRDITNIKIQERNLGLVFQDFSLFPHMRVRENISFPLKVRKMPIGEIEERVKSVSSEMNISHLLHRRPDLLSGGEKQRVALARTLVTSPDVLLLDEPLASVDASLKDSIRHMLRRLNREGQTIIHVTHDFSEAISLASRVGVIHNGYIIQEGTPREVFAHPVNRFVARYTGIKNFFRVQFVKEIDNWIGLTDKGNRIKLTGTDYPSGGLLIIGSNEVLLSRLNPVNDNFCAVRGVIDDIVPSFAGYEVSVNAGEFIFADIGMKEMESEHYMTGEEVWVVFNPDSIRSVTESEETKHKN
jgi:ABC-type sugar transport system ATPase subunit